MQLSHLAVCLKRTQYYKLTVLQKKSMLKQNVITEPTSACVFLSVKWKCLPSFSILNKQMIFPFPKEGLNMIHIYLRRYREIRFL